MAVAAQQEQLFGTTQSRWILLCGATIAEIMLLVLPSFVGALTDELRLSSLHVGLLGSADMLGTALIGASGPFWVRRVSWKRGVCSALLALLLCNAVCFWVREFEPLLALRLMAGLAAGAIYTICLTGLMSGRDPARNGGLLLFSEVVVSALGVYLIDEVPIGARLNAVYAYAVLLIVLFIPWAWRHLPDDPGGPVRGEPLPWSMVARRGALLLLGAGSYFLMIGGVWGYLEGIARAANVALAQTGQAISTGLIVSLLGASAAAGLGLRFGRAIPLVGSAVIQITALFLLMRLQRFTTPLVAFYLINAGFQIAWSYVVPYFMVLFKEVEPSGRFVPMYSMAMHLMLAVGPYAGAFVIHNGHYEGLLAAGVALAVICYASFLIALWLNRHADGSRPAHFRVP
jgi:predicted MFS family arabinose efflux permease